MASKVVLIDNDSQVRGVVCAALEQDGFVTVGVGNYSAPAPVISHAAPLGLVRQRGSHV